MEVQLIGQYQISMVGLLESHYQGYGKKHSTSIVLKPYVNYIFVVANFDIGICIHTPLTNREYVTAHRRMVFSNFINQIFEAG